MKKEILRNIENNWEGKIEKEKLNKEILKKNWEGKIEKYWKKIEKQMFKLKKNTTNSCNLKKKTSEATASDSTSRWSNSNSNYCCRL